MRSLPRCSQWRIMPQGRVHFLRQEEGPGPGCSSVLACLLSMWVAGFNLYYSGIKEITRFWQVAQDDLRSRILQLHFPPNSPSSVCILWSFLCSSVRVLIFLLNTYLNYDSEVLAIRQWDWFAVTFSQDYRRWCFQTRNSCFHHKPAWCMDL